MAAKRTTAATRTAITGQHVSTAADRSQHVIPHEGGTWAVKKTGAAKVSRTFATQSEAIQHGRSVAHNAGTVLYVHGKDGRVVTRVAAPPATGTKKR